MQQVMKIAGASAIDEESEKKGKKVEIIVLIHFYSLFLSEN